MLSMFARNWWLFALQGVAAIIFGILEVVAGIQCGILLIILAFRLRGMREGEAGAV